LKAIFITSPPPNWTNNKKAMTKQRIFIIDTLLKVVNYRSSEDNLYTLFSLCKNVKHSDVLLKEQLDFINKISVDIAKVTEKVVS
jgi:hypothetical protein